MGQDLKILLQILREALSCPTFKLKRFEERRFECTPFMLFSKLPFQIRFALSVFYYFPGSFINRFIAPQRNRLQLHEYWRRPADGVNDPQTYLEGKERSMFLIELISNYVDKDASILEVGCNVGRNLNYLFLSGFTRLSGIEISTEACNLMKKCYPKMAWSINVFNDSAENTLPRLPDDSFDVVFTMAVLQHIHPESEFIFNHISRVTRKFLITIEDEYGVSWRNFPRNYKKIFEKLGMKCVETVGAYGMAKLGLHPTYVCRVFVKGRQLGNSD